MIVVSDTTPLSELTKVGQLELLYKLYGTVIIPQEVFEEVTQGKHPAALAVPAASWVRVMSISNRQRLCELQTEAFCPIGFDSTKNVGIISSWVALSPGVDCP